MNTYLVTFDMNWKTHKVKVDATTSKYARGQVTNKHKGCHIESCVKVGCPIPEINDTRDFSHLKLV